MSGNIVTMIVRNFLGDGYKDMDHDVAFNKALQSLTETMDSIAVLEWLEQQKHPKSIKIMEGSRKIRKIPLSRYERVKRYLLEDAIRNWTNSSQKVSHAQEDQEDKEKGKGGEGGGKVKRKPPHHASRNTPF